MVRSAAAKSVDCRFSRSGSISTSSGDSSARCLSVSRCIMIVTAWFETASAEVSSLRPTGWKPTSTAITMSTPMPLATSTGRFSTMPPSTSRRPSTSTGANTPGADMLARIAAVRSPPASTMRAPVSRSAATARNGVGSSSKFSTAATGIVSQPQRLRQALALDQAARHAEAAALDAEREAHQEFAVVLLAAEIERVARGTVAERGVPVDAAHQRVDLVRRHARGVEPADDGAHARARDGVDRDAQLLERLQHADVGEPARAAAGQHEPDARPRRGRPPLASCASRRGCGRQPRQQQAK